jgi:hypothetical protein
VRTMDIKKSTRSMAARPKNLSNPLIPLKQLVSPVQRDARTISAKVRHCVSHKSRERPFMAEGRTEKRPVTSVSCSEILAGIWSEDKRFWKAFVRIKKFGASCGHVLRLGGQALKPLSPKQPSHRSNKSAMRSCCALFSHFCVLLQHGSQEEGNRIGF